MNNSPQNNFSLPLQSRSASVREKNDIGAIFGFITSTLLGVVLSMAAPSSGHVSQGFCWIVLLNVWLTVAVLFYKKCREKKPINWLTPDVSFTVSFIVVHFLYVFLWLTHIFDLGSEIWYFRRANCPHTVCSTIAMCSACLSIFHLGYCLVKTKRRLGPSKINPGWQLLGKVMTRISLLGLAGFIVILGNSFLGGHYSGTSGGGATANTLFNIFQGLILASIAVVVISRAPIKSNSKRLAAVDIILAVIGALALLIHGDRSTFLLIMLALVTSYSEFVKPIKLRTGIIAFFGLLMLLGISQIARSRAVGERSISSFYRVGSQHAGDSVELSAKTFSSSALTAFVAVDFVPNEHEYYYGKMKVLSVSGMVPFGRRLFGIKQDETTSSSNLFTLLIQGSTRGVSGTGTSVFADFYLDGGFPCCLVAFLGMGLFFRWIVEKSRSTNDIRWHVCFVCLVSVLSISARMLIIDLVVRQVFYPVIYTFVIGWLLGIRYRSVPAAVKSFFPSRSY